MSLGAGIFWSTLVVVVAMAVWQVSVSRKWRTVGKVILWLALLVAIIGAISWGWSRYQDRPQVVTELSGVKLGMSPVEVKLALGEPTDKSEVESDAPGQRELAYLFYEHSEQLHVLFRERAKQFAADVICEEGGYSRLLGFSHHSDEKDVVKKLGAPARTSIDKAGLTKIISYPKWRAAYVIEKGLVKGVCTSTSGEVAYREEFTASPEEPQRTSDSSTGDLVPDTAPPTGLHFVPLDAPPSAIPKVK